MIIDFHTHIFSPEVVENRNKFFDDENFQLLYSSEKAKLIDHNALIREMDNADVDYAVALGYPWEKEENYELQNQYFKDVPNLSGGRIYPFGTIPLTDENEIGAHVKRIKEMGLSGIGEIGFYSTGFSSINEKTLIKIFEAASINALPLVLHVNESVGHEYIGKYETDFKRLYAVLREFNDLTVILAHWGGGILFYELMPEVRESFENIYYDTAASPYIYDDRIYDVALRILGSEKILFGTDYPLINFRKYLKTLDTVVSNENDRMNILGLNAMRILNIEG
jgi:predicted TIM-barrel fold metal-dependent hydrolase